MPQSPEFNAIRITLASPEQIRRWSYGEVTKPETINYRTLKPEKDGLFCERIFGPVKDWECACGKYKKSRYRGVVCDRCGVEVAPSRVRRERMGHIQLATPVAHIWFFRGTPNRLALLLDLSPRDLESVIYFSQYIVTQVDEEAKQKALAALRQSVESQARKQGKEGEGAEGEGRESAHEEELQHHLKELENLKPLTCLSETQYRELKGKYGDMFKAGMGAEALLEILRSLDLEALGERLKEEVRTTTGQHQAKALKRLRIVEAFRRSKNKPEWMILTVLPVLPPELRPMIQLDGGRFATSDLNDLYRRVINRNNRLKRLLEIRAPEIIIRNEKRMLQEAVDALIDNGRRGRPLAGSRNHRLKSLTDLLEGKQGRFRQNLLGKRVDYSGRSVIVVGPELKLHQCGLPKRMALELFKPFVMNRLVLKGYASNIKSAKRMVERGRPEVWDVLAEVTQERPVLLNRAPTLHRLSIQAFYPVLIEGSAIQLHPLVCAAFNADFDGDQMAVHLPLSREAVREAKKIMLSTHNLLSPASGEPITTPSLDIVLGCYYLTMVRPGAKGEGARFRDKDEARLAHDLGLIDLQAAILLRDPTAEEGWLRTTVGRILFNDVLPPELRFKNEIMDKKALKELVAQCHRQLGSEVTARMLDEIKRLGFHYATQSGISITMNDIQVPKEKAAILAEADEKIAQLEEQYEMGLISDEERYKKAIEIWQEASDKTTALVERELREEMEKSNPRGIYMMAFSGTKGNISQIKQMAGMRGLMSNPRGQIIDLPIRSSFKEGLSVLEYFISTHGARKGLADTALRTADSGYLTRRLIDVAQEVIVSSHDCGTTEGIWIKESSDPLMASLEERILGRVAAAPVVSPTTGEVLVAWNEEIDHEKAARVKAEGVKEVYVRSPITCRARRGVCQLCYGWSPASGKLVMRGEAVGIVAAQSIGEPGTQLTMRTFHTGGVAVEADITTGLPRVEELFEARAPKGQAILAELDGEVQIEETPEQKRIRIINVEEYQEEYQLPPGHHLLVQEGQRVEAGTPLSRAPSPEGGEGEASLQLPGLVAQMGGEVCLQGEGRLVLKRRELKEKEYTLPPTARILVEPGQKVRAGDALTAGPKNPQDLLTILGQEAVQQYLIQEIQKVYRAQGVNINDKHIEVILRQMLRRVKVDSPGDTDFLPGELVDRLVFEEENQRVLAEGGELATAIPVLLGITRASLNVGQRYPDSFLAAASFQETMRVLTEAAINGAVDRLQGLKENVIIGRLIPTRQDVLEEGPRPVEGELEGPSGDQDYLAAGAP